MSRCAMLVISVWQCEQQNIFIVLETFIILQINSNLLSTVCFILALLYYETVNAIGY